MAADEDLDAIKIPLTDVRAYVVERMREGIEEVSLRDFLYWLQEIYRKSKNETGA